MTVEIILSKLYKILDSLPKDPEGWVSIKDFLDIAAKEHNCTELTVRNFVNKSKDSFNMRHGYVRHAVGHAIENQIKDEVVYQAWLKLREKILDECTSFLKYQTPSPMIDYHLITIANAREELKSYIDNKFTSLLLDLKKVYGFTPQTTL